MGTGSSSFRTGFVASGDVMGTLYCSGNGAPGMGLLVPTFEPDLDFFCALELPTFEPDLDFFCAFDFFVFPTFELDLDFFCALDFFGCPTFELDLDFFFAVDFWPPFDPDF